MKKFIVLISLILLISCAEHLPEIDPANPAYAFYVIFESLINESVDLNNINYAALDLTDIESLYIVPFIQLVQNYCDTNGYTLLLMDFEELKENGYLTSLEHDLDRVYFEKGVLISFFDEELSENTLTTSAHSWNAWSRGAEFTVEKVNDSWEITSVDRPWVS
jgi:hypothetical protein